MNPRFTSLSQCSTFVTIRLSCTVYGSNIANWLASFPPSIVIFTALLDLTAPVETFRNEYLEQRGSRHPTTLLS